MEKVQKKAGCLVCKKIKYPAFNLQVCAKHNVFIGEECRTDWPISIRQILVFRIDIAIYFYMRDSIQLQVL